MSNRSIGNVLEELIRNGITGPSDLARVGDISRTSINNLRKNERPGVFESALRSWLNNHPSDHVRNALLFDLTNGQAVFLSDCPSLHLDFNGDGKTDLQDGMKASIEALDSIQGMLSGLLEGCQRDPGSIAIKQRLEIYSHVQTVEKLLDGIKRICTQEVPTRKSARISSKKGGTKNV